MTDRKVLENGGVVMGASSPSAPTALAPPSGVKPASGLEQSRSSHGATLRRSYSSALPVFADNDAIQACGHYCAIFDWDDADPEAEGVFVGKTETYPTMAEAYAAATAFIAASVDTHPKGGDATQIAAPSPMSGAVPEGQTPTPSGHPGERA